MYLVNKFGRVIEESDPQICEKGLKARVFREATAEEIDRYHAHRAEMNAPAKGVGGVYYQTVPSSPDGYGMSRDHLKMEMARQGIVLSESYDDQKVGLLYNYPHSVVSMRSPIRLIFTMFESDKLPEDWPDYLAAADEVIVPSKWCQRIFDEAGIKSTVIPLGYNSRMFQVIDRAVPECTPEDPFTFVHYDSFNVRKGFMEVLSAFHREFGKDMSVRLILKTVAEYSPLPVPKAEYPNVEVIRGWSTEQDLSDMLGRSHCMVYPSRGEGFGITPLEAMATGLPAIVPNAHGISEYFNSDFMLEAKVGGKCPGLYNRFRGQDVGDMIVCDIPDLQKQMRFAYDNPKEMKALGLSASIYAKGYTYSKTAEKLAQVLQKWQAVDVVKRKDSKFLTVENV
jgi:glycosyltransferase involved in cell wall biosynthesis